MGRCESLPPSLTQCLVDKMMSLQYSACFHWHPTWFDPSWTKLILLARFWEVLCQIYYHFTCLLGAAGSVINGSRHVPHFIVASVNVSVPSADMLLNYFLSSLGSLQWSTGQIYLCISYQDHKALNALLWTCCLCKYWIFVYTWFWSFCLGQIWSDLILMCK